MNALITLAIICVAVHIVSSIMIYHYLRVRGERLCFPLIKLFIFSYVKRYRELTREETGKTGPLFYVWTISINLALIPVLLLIISKI